MPDITLNDVEKAFKEMKSNKSPGDDGIVVEAIKLGGRTFLRALTKLCNECLTPS